MSVDHDRIQAGVRRFMARTSGKYPCAVVVPEPMLERLLRCPIAVSKMRVARMRHGGVPLIALSYLGMWLIAGSDPTHVLLCEALEDEWVILRPDDPHMDAPGR